MNQPYNLNCLTCGTKVRLHSEDMGDNGEGYKFDNAYKYLVGTLRDMNKANHVSAESLREMARAVLIDLGESTL